MAALGIFSRMKKAVQSPFNRTPQVEHNKHQAADMVGLDQVFLHYFRCFGQGGGGGRGVVLPLMTGRLRPEGVPFSGFRYVKG